MRDDVLADKGPGQYLGWPLYVGVCLILIGVTFTFLVPEPGLWHKILIAGVTELGFAFFIAHVIIIVIDRKEKKDFSDYVKEEQRKTEEELKIAERRLATRAALSYLLDTDLPKVITDEIEQFILSSKLIKRHQMLTFSLETLDRDAMLAFEAESLFENPRHHSVDFDPPYLTFGENFVEGHFRAKYPQERIGLQTYVIFLKRAKESDFKLVYDRSAAADSELSKLRESYLLAPGDQIRVRVSDRKPRFGIDNEVFTNFSFCEKMEIYLKYDRDAFEVDYRALHSKSKVMRAEPYFGGLRLVLDAPFLPSNGVLVWWRRVNRQPLLPLVLPDQPQAIIPVGR